MKIPYREKILIIVGALFVSLSGLYLLVVKPIYLKHKSTLNKIEKKQLLLNRYKAILDREDQLKERMVFIKKEFAKLNNFLLTGKKPSLAAAELQVLLENITKKVKVTTKNVKNKKPDKKDFFFRIPLEITIQSTLRELKDVIYHIENLDKFILLRDLNTRLIKSDNPEKLESKLVVDGFIKISPNE